MSVQMSLLRRHANVRSRALSRGDVAPTWRQGPCTRHRARQGRELRRYQRRGRRRYPRAPRATEQRPMLLRSSAQFDSQPSSQPVRQLSPKLESRRVAPRREWRRPQRRLQPDRCCESGLQCPRCQHATLSKT
eukprot:6179650-Pleurochrysis_carterae.AAC.3